jgi:hypothetical protein
MTLSAKKTANELSRLPTVEEMARDRFGDIDGLAIVQKTTLDLSKHYARRFGLDSADPEVTLITSALAFARHKEFTLLVELERDLFSRVATSPEGASYGETLFNVTRTGAYKEIHRELDRLHTRASKYLNELRELSGEQES